MCLAYLFEHVGFCENKNVFYLVLKKAVFRGFVLLAKHDIQFAFAYIPMSMAQRLFFLWNTERDWNESGIRSKPLQTLALPLVSIPLCSNVLILL